MSESVCDDSGGQISVSVSDAQTKRRRLQRKSQVVQSWQAEEKKRGRRQKRY